MPSPRRDHEPCRTSASRSCRASSWRLHQVFGDGLAHLQETFGLAGALSGGGFDRHFAGEIDELAVEDAAGAELGDLGADDVAGGERFSQLELARVFVAVGVALDLERLRERAILSGAIDG